MSLVIFTIIKCFRIINVLKYYRHQSSSMSESHIVTKVLKHVPFPFFPFCCWFSSHCKIAAVVLMLTVCFYKGAGKKF